MNTVKLPIYLDYSATTPVDPRVAAEMIPYLTELFGNSASRSHSFGWTADDAVEKARAEVADLLHADTKEIVWTSGATESNNFLANGATLNHDHATVALIACSAGVAFNCQHCVSANLDDNANV